MFLSLWIPIQKQTLLQFIFKLGSNNSLDGTNHFEKHQVVSVVVTPNDGIEDGASVASSDVTISKRTPSNLTICITPEDPLPGADDVLCQVDSLYDADGDTLTYDFVWTVDGSAYNGVQATTTHRGDTIEGSVTTNPETWTCTLTLTDDDGASVSSATIEVLVGCEDESVIKSSCPAEDCAEILHDGFSVGDGLYWIFSR